MRPFFHYSVRCLTLQSREFLTGFHKRKLAKKEEGKKRAQAREKEERLEARREVRTLFMPLRFLSPTLESPKYVFDRYSNGGCSQSRLLRMLQKLKRRMVALRNVRPIPVFPLTTFGFFAPG